MLPLEYDDIKILLEQAPLHLWEKRYGSGEVSQSPYEIEQDAIKRAILSKNAFYAKYAVGKKTYNHAQFLSEKAGRAKVDNKVFLKKEAYDLVMDMGGEYSRNGVLNQFLQDGEKLKKVDFEIDGVSCVSEIDILNLEKNVIVFIKATKKAGEAFEREIFKQNCHAEMAFAFEAIQQNYEIAPQCLFVAIEKERRPYVCGVHELPQEGIELGLKQIQKAIELFKFSEKEGYRNYFGGRVRRAEVPQWLNN